MSYRCGACGAALIRARSLKVMEAQMIDPETGLVIIGEVERQDLELITEIIRCLKDGFHETGYKARNGRAVRDEEKGVK